MGQTESQRCLWSGLAEQRQQTLVTQWSELQDCQSDKQRLHLSFVTRESPPNTSCEGDKGTMTRSAMCAIEQNNTEQNKQRNPKCELAGTRGLRSVPARRSAQTQHIFRDGTLHKLLQLKLGTPSALGAIPALMRPTHLCRRRRQLGRLKGRCSPLVRSPHRHRG